MVEWAGIDLHWHLLRSFLPPSPLLGAVVAPPVGPRSTLTVAAGDEDHYESEKNNKSKRQVT